MPFDIDYNVMDTFLDFYKALIRFVNYKLYNDVGLSYPPERMDQDSKDGSRIDQHKLKIMQDVACEKLYGKESRDKQDISEEFMQTPEYAQMMQREETLSKLRNMFKDKVFFMNREVPMYSLEFIIPAFSGKYGYEGEGSPYSIDSKEITHHVMDRNMDASKMQFSKNRDFVVPQWVYDSINHQVDIPVSQYKPGSPPPPHLSPFVDNKAEGYIPKRQEEINEIKGVTEEVFDVEVDEESQPDEEMEEEKGGKGDKYDGDSSSEDEADQQKAAKNSEKQKKMKSKLKDSLQQERKELGKLLMTKKARKLYTRINYSQRRKREGIQKLQDKREVIESKKAE
jgi:pescadillo protein